MALSVTAHLLVFFSGAAALAHQILWTRRLVDVFGAAALTFSKVAGAFFLGFAIGGWLASRIRHSRIGFYGLFAFAELAIALLALPVLFFPQLAEHLPGKLVFHPVFKTIAPLILILPPGICMGLTLPSLFRALASDRSSLAVSLYGINTLGGILGIAAVLFIGLPLLGITKTGLAISSINFLIALVILFLRPTRRKHRSASISELPSVALPGKIAFMAFISGFQILGLEVLLQHQFTQVTINSFFSSSTVLAMVLGSLFLAVILAPRLYRAVGGFENCIGFSLVLACAVCLLQPLLFSWMRPNLQILPYELQPLLYFLEVSKLGLVVLAPLILASGLIFPCLMQQISSLDPSQRSLGVLFAWNGLGGWVGTEVIQYLVAPRQGIWGSVAILGSIYFLLFLWWSRKSLMEELSQTNLPRAAAFSILALLFLSAWHLSSLPQASLQPSERLLALRVGPEGVVATVKSAPGDQKILFNNSYTLGGSLAQFNQERQAHLPILFHGHARSVALLGVATGSTVAGAALHPEVREIVAFELSPIVLDFARDHFGKYNRQVFQHEKVSMLAEDARWGIARYQNHFDVVIGDLFLPWRTGEARLFTVEHFLRVRNSLKEDGLFCQWLPLFQLTREQFDCIARTFRSVFPRTLLVRGDFYTDLPIVGLLGNKEISEIDWNAVEKCATALRESNATTDVLVRHGEGVAMMLIGTLPEITEGPINTLGNMALEWDAADNIIGLQKPWFTGIPSAEFFRARHRNALPLLPENLRSAHDAGQFFLTLEIAAKFNLTVLDNLKSQIPERVPKKMQNDRGADWETWPMRVKPVW